LNNTIKKLFKHTQIHNVHSNTHTYIHRQCVYFYIFDVNVCVCSMLVILVYYECILKYFETILIVIIIIIIIKQLQYRSMLISRYFQSRKQRNVIFIWNYFTFKEIKTLKPQLWRLFPSFLDPSKYVSTIMWILNLLRNKLSHRPYYIRK